MSTLKSPQLRQFYLKLSRRGISVEFLADAIGCSRSALTRVLNGARRRGPIWTKVLPLLRPEEVELLDVALASTWNTGRLEKQPVWTPEKQARLRRQKAALSP